MARLKAGTCASPKSQLTADLRKKGYYPISEIAKRIGLHYSTVYRWARENIVEHLDFGGAYYIKWSSVVDHLGVVASVLNLSKESPYADKKTAVDHKQNKKRARR